MKFKPEHSNFRLPVRSSVSAGGLDIYMPEEGTLHPGDKLSIGLGFSAAVPPGFVAMILPRSSAGSQGLEVINTVGIIDADYRGQWFAKLQLKPNSRSLSWKENDRLLQMVIVPVANVTPVLVGSLDETERGDGGFGSTGS